jgi:hypothetical protein
MLAADLFHDPNRRSYGAMPEADALTEPHALQEAALIDVRFSALYNSVGLLFDLRVALQFREPKVAVLIGRDVTRLEWEAVPFPHSRVWFANVGSTPDTRSQLFRLELHFVPNARLTLQSRGAEFYVGDMDGVDGAPPDFGEDDDATIRRRMPSWDARFLPLAATFLDPYDAS